MKFLIKLFSLISIWSSIQSQQRSTIVAATIDEIWSVYFDLTQDMIKSDNKQVHRQIISPPSSTFESNQLRYINEIRTFIESSTSGGDDGSSSNKIRSMELLLCDVINDNDDDDQSNLSNDRRKFIKESIITDGDGRKHFCIDRLVSLKSSSSPELQSNETVLKYPGQNIGLRYDSSRMSLLLSIEYTEPNYIDNSGFDLYLICIDQNDNSEMIEAGIMAIGFIPDSTFFIPPQMKQWSIKGVCNKDICFNNDPIKNIEIISIVSSVNHRYLQEMNVKLIDHDNHQRIVRINDLNDLNKGQQSNIINTRSLNLNELKKINVECHFRNKLNRTIKAGFNTNEENCLIWINYYPRLNDLNACLSTHSLSTIMSILNVNNIDVTMAGSNQIDMKISINNNTNESMNIDDYINIKDRTNDWNLKKLLRIRTRLMSAENGRIYSQQCGWNHNNLDLINFNRLRRRKRRISIH